MHTGEWLQLGITTGVLFGIFRLVWRASEMFAKVNVNGENITDISGEIRELKDETTKGMGKLNKACQRLELSTNRLTTSVETLNGKMSDHSEDCNVDRKDMNNRLTIVETKLDLGE